MTTRTRIEVAVAVFLLAWVALSGLKVRQARAALLSAENTRDSLAIEAAANRAEADGWATTFAQETENLQALIADRDEQARALTESLRTAYAQVRSLTDVVATLTDSLTSVGEVSDTSATGEVTYRGQIADGLLTASWAFLAPSLDMSYAVMLPLEIVTSEGGDGRTLVTARATDPRASVTVEGFWVQKPEPVVLQRCGIIQTAKRVGLGALLGAIAR